MLSRLSVETHQGIKLTKNSSKNAFSLSSQLAEPLWTDPWHKKSGIGTQELIFTEKKKAQAENDSLNLSP